MENVKGRQQKKTKKLFDCQPRHDFIDVHCMEQICSGSATQKRYTEWTQFYGLTLQIKI
jgi:hypothetical protein